MKVINKNGTAIDFDAAVSMMDDDIRESVHAELAPCTEQEFFAAYEIAHAAKYGEWELSKANPCY
uniref:AcrIC5-like domain-containing protein n=1 Tax=Myoviridae sp. ctzS633 TaxID=2825212 RepID=A0A8S5PV94_9CAUD|nr:MAG TPA: hypothetical protein [Myoviridae sp. ctzS633]